MTRSREANRMSATGTAVAGVVLILIVDDFFGRVPWKLAYQLKITIPT